MNCAFSFFDFGFKLKSLHIFLYFLFITLSVEGQILESLPDSLQKVLAKLPESQHDSIYLKIGGASYQKLTTGST